MKKDSTWWQGQLPIYVTVAALIVVALLLMVYKGDLGPKEIGPAVLSLLGTFLGAFLAFRLQRLKEREADELAKVELLNRALIVLCLQYNDLLAWQPLLNKYTDKLDRMINLPAARPGDKFDSRQQIEGLAFLIDRGHSNLIMKLAIEQWRFDAAHTVLTERARIHAEEVQRKFEEHQFNHQTLDEDTVRQAFGDRLFGTLETATNQVYEHVPATVISLKALIAELHAAAKGIYPNRTFVTLAS